MIVISSLVIFYHIESPWLTLVQPVCSCRKSSVVVVVPLCYLTSWRYESPKPVAVWRQTGVPASEMLNKNVWAGLQNRIGHSFHWHLILAAIRLAWSVSPHTNHISAPAINIAIHDPFLLQYLYRVKPIAITIYLMSRPELVWSQCMVDSVAYLWSLHQIWARSLCPSTGLF